MSAAFTPGPWRWVGRNEIEQAEHPFTSVAEAVDVFKVDEQRDANARLIAAAPDLYEALENAAHTFRRYEEMHVTKGTAEGDMKARANAKKAKEYEAVLAKARGEQ